MLEGSIVYRLEKTEVKSFSKTMWIEFNKYEYVDSRTVSSKRMKKLQNMSFDRGMAGDRRMIVEEESSLEISSITETENSEKAESPQKR